MLPQYEITDILGRGGMGAVYKGRQSNLDREVAIKVLPETFTKGDDELNFAARFKQEARAMAKLDHPAIISVYDFGETPDGQLYFIMEFIDGMDIHQYLHHHGGKLPQDQALSITAHVLDALDYAHSHGIVHRDIKPANILLNREGRVKIADFGLAKKLEEAGGDSVPALTMTNVAVGTPDFVAPEALDSSQKPDHRADLYAVGVMLYQMLTGKLPRGQFKSPSALDSGIDPRLDVIVSKSLQPHPDDRYSSASMVRADLDVIFSHPFAKVEAGEDSAVVAAVVPVTTSVKGQPPAKAGRYTPAVPERSKLPLFLGIGAACAVLVGLAVMATRGAKEEESSTGILPGPPSVVFSMEKAVEAEQSSIAPSPNESSTENTGKMPVPQEEAPASPPAATAAPAPVETPPAPDPPLTDAAPAEPTVAATNPAPSVTPPTANSPPPSEPVAAPAQPAPLASLPGLKARLDGYHTARSNQLGSLATKYLGGLEVRLNQAADAGDLKLATAYGDEKARVQTLQRALSQPPADPVAAVSDATALSLPALDEGSPEPLVALRQTWTNESAKINATLEAALQQSLQVLEADLTRARDFESAKAVLAWRESLHAEGSAGTPARMEAGAVASATTEEAGKSARAPSDLSAATKDEPFENSLSMKFVPVPGTEVLFCIHETRWRDYEEYAEDVDNVSPHWKTQTHDGFEVKDDAEDHPVVNVSWGDAEAFCQWLSKKEGKIYRLPTDREWSVAAGIGELEVWDPSTTPETVAKSNDLFPWGKEWPPVEVVGNYSDESRKKKASPPGNALFIDGYDDGFPTTAPVMSLTPNELGLYDLSGNAWEWVSDWYSDAALERTARGASWNDAIDASVWLSARKSNRPDNLYYARGFRVVVETVAPSTAPASTPTPVAAARPSGSSKNPFGWQPISENTFPLPRPTRPTTPCRVVAWRLDGQPVDEAAFRKVFGGVPADLGEVVDLSAKASPVSQFIYPLGLSPDGNVVALNQQSNQLLPAGVKPSVAIDGGRDIALALHEDGSVSPLFLAPMAGTGEQWQGQVN